MLVTQLIAKKREERKLSPEEIKFLVESYTKGEIPDYQFSAFLMAAYLRGLDAEETFHLTKAMLDSGEKIDLSTISLPKIDKHSTGGVGDKVSLILAPMVAACGVAVPMISGRGLGHTGGTLDKLESIPWFRTDLSLKEFKANLEQIGLCLIGQTDEIAPADKKIYALRDVTATVDYIPFITASILSKKLAEGAEGIIFDVKVGNGAFMKSLPEAKSLARSLLSVGQKFNKQMTAVLTDMSEPLGSAVGNSLEIIESIEALKGNWSGDLKQLTYFLGAEMLIMAKKCSDCAAAYQLLEKVNLNGSALDKLREMVRLQGGDIAVLEDYSRLPVAKVILEAKSEKRGFVNRIETERVGQLAIELGAGRKRKEDMIDHSAGFIIRKKTGDRVERGEVLAEIHCHDRELAEKVAEPLKECFHVQNKAAKRLKKVLYRITPRGGEAVPKKLVWF